MYLSETTPFPVFDRNSLLLIVCRVLVTIETCPQFLALGGRGRCRRSGNSSGTTRNKRCLRIWLKLPVAYLMSRMQSHWKRQLCVDSRGIFSWTSHIEPNQTSILGSCELSRSEIDPIAEWLIVFCLVENFGSGSYSVSLRGIGISRLLISLFF